MPAKKTVSKEKIVEAALKIVQKRGMDGLNMRALAKECNCSTQPIYLAFGSAKALKSEVRSEIFRIYNDYKKREIACGEYPEYKATGMAYIRFAKERSEFFKYLFMRNRAGVEDPETEADFSDEQKMVSSAYNLSNGAAARLHTHMWVWVHGIATMYATGYLDWDRETVSKMLTEEFIGIKSSLNI